MNERNPRADSCALPRWLGWTVLAGILALQAFAVAWGLDWRDYDDLSRTLLARGWAARPYYMSDDGYWLTLPSIVRGAWLRLFPAVWRDAPLASVTLMRLVTVAALWGCWRLLVEAIGLLGGGRGAVLLFSAFFLFNGGTFHFAASNLSEPDATFWTLAALVAVLGGVARGVFSGRRMLTCGLALAAACQTRYEAWIFPPLLGAFILWHERGRLRPWGRWAGLLLPVVPITVWLVLSELHQGSPFHFLQLNRYYVGIYRPPQPLAAMVRCFLRIHPLWLPLAAVFGASLLYRQRRRRVAQAYALMTGALLFWALFRLWTYVMTVRYTWDATLLLAAAGAVGLEQAGRGRWKAWAGRWGWMLAVLSLVLFVWMLGRQQPYIPVGLREFAGAVQARTADGKILLRDHGAPDQAIALQSFRVLISESRLVPEEYIAHGRTVTPAELPGHHIRYILGRREPGSLGDGGAPLLSEAGSGWALWHTGVPTENTPGRPQGDAFHL